MIERTGINPGFINSEVDRRTSDPGQVLAGLIGQLKIIELRECARAVLGANIAVRSLKVPQ